MRTGSLLLVIVLLLPGASFGGPPPRYFPLDPGNTWTYTREGGGGVEQVVQVVGFEEGLTLLSFDGAQVRIDDRQAELDIELPGEGLVPYYRFNEKSFLHRDPFICDDKQTLEAAPTLEVVVTPAGVFTDCLRFDYRGSACADAGTVSEWWKLEVGRVQWIDESIMGPRTHVLKSFERSGGSRSFRRGDGDGGGKIGLSDAIMVLNWLFTGGPSPGCRDAADANDDGEVDIADPISVLGYLFLGTAAPPPPGPETCGDDPTADDLPACTYLACTAGPVE